MKRGGIQTNKTMFPRRKGIIIRTVWESFSGTLVGYRNVHRVKLFGQKRRTCPTEGERGWGRCKGVLSLEVFVERGRSGSSVLRVRVGFLLPRDPRGRTGKDLRDSFSAGSGGCRPGKVSSKRTRSRVLKPGLGSKGVIPLICLKPIYHCQKVLTVETKQGLETGVVDFSTITSLRKVGRYLSKENEIRRFYLSHTKYLLS